MLEGTLFTDLLDSFVEHFSNVWMATRLAEPTTAKPKSAVKDVMKCILKETASKRVWMLPNHEEVAKEEYVLCD